MKTYLIYLLISLNLFFLNSCSKNEGDKFVLLFDYDSTHFFYNKVYTNNDFGEQDLDDSFTFKLNDTLLENGDFDEGMKKGIWFYNIFDKNGFNVNWTINNNYNDFEISLPPNFKQRYADSIYFLGWFENKDSLNNFFVIYKNAQYSETIENFWRINTCGSLRDNVTFYQCVEMRVDGKKMYLSKYQKLENKKGYTVFNLILEHNGDVYDMSIKDVLGNEQYELFIFLEMIRNIKIDNKKIFNYVLTDFEMKDISEQSFKENSSIIK